MNAFYTLPIALAAVLALPSCQDSTSEIQTTEAEPQLGPNELNQAQVSDLERQQWRGDQEAMKRRLALLEQQLADQESRLAGREVGGGAEPLPLPTPEPRQAIVVAAPEEEPVFIEQASLDVITPDRQGEQLEQFILELEPHGTWLEHPSYGRVWRASASGDPSWKPYLLGQWVDSDQGWLWVSDEPFGWIVYHYGRWALDPRFGWVWIPGHEWAPAWVAWSEVEDTHVGWAPLPPEDCITYVDEHPVIDWGNQPIQHFTFIQVVNFGLPVGPCAIPRNRLTGIFNQHRVIPRWRRYQNGYCGLGPERNRLRGRGGALVNQRLERHRVERQRADWREQNTNRPQSENTSGNQGHRVDRDRIVIRDVARGEQAKKRIADLRSRRGSHAGERPRSGEADSLEHARREQVEAARRSEALKRAADARRVADNRRSSGNSDQGRGARPSTTDTARETPSRQREGRIERAQEQEGSRQAVAGNQDRRRQDAAQAQRQREQLQRQMQAEEQEKVMEQAQRRAEEARKSAEMARERQREQANRAKEQSRQRAAIEAQRRAEAARRQQMEEQAQKAREAAARQKAAEDSRRRQTDQAEKAREAAKQRAVENARRRQNEQSNLAREQAKQAAAAKVQRDAETTRRREMESQAQKVRETAAASQKLREEAKRRQAQQRGSQEAQQKAEMARRQQMEQQAQKAREAAAKQKAVDEARRRQVEQAAKVREAAKQRAAAEAKRRQIEQANRAREQARQRAAQEAQRKAEAARRKQMEEQAQKAREAAARQKAAAEARRRQAEQAEKARQAAQKRAAEEARRRQAEQAERARRRAEEARKKSK